MVEVLHAQTASLQRGLASNSGKGSGRSITKDKCNYSKPQPACPSDPLALQHDANATQTQEQQDRSRRARQADRIQLAMASPRPAMPRIP